MTFRLEMPSDKCADNINVSAVVYNYHQSFQFFHRTIIKLNINFTVRSNDSQTSFTCLLQSQCI